MARNTQWRICSGIPAWNRYNVCGLHSEALVSPYFYIFSWPSREVSINPWSRASMIWFPWYNRVLIANIRNLGMCPCPRCLTPKNQRNDLGSNNDMQQRKVLACVDTEEHWGKVTAACRLIYQQHYVIDTPQVEALLKPESLLPTKVLVFLWLWCHSCSVLIVVFRTHFPKSWVHWALIFSWC